MFKEQMTDPRRWSASRGWGFTQKTYFDKEQTMLDKSGDTRKYEMYAGLPYSPKGTLTRPNPLSIASAKV